MALKVKIPCPKCDAKGVIPQYFYNRKGICFLCWGDKYIYAKVPQGKTAEEVHADLVKKEKPDFKKNPPKVAMPHKDEIKNKSYFKQGNSKVDIKAAEPKKEEPKKKPEVSEEDKKEAQREKRRKDRELRAKVRDMFDMASATSDIGEWKQLLADIQALPDYTGKGDDIEAVKDTIKHLQDMEQARKMREAINGILKKHANGNRYGNTVAQYNAMLQEALELPDGTAKDDFVKLLMDERELAVKAAAEDGELEKRKNKNAADYKAALDKRAELVAESVADEILDTDLGKKVKERIGEGVTKSEDAVAIGEIVSEELDKLRKKYDDSDENKERIQLEKDKDESYQRYLKANSEYSKAKGLDERNRLADIVNKEVEVFNEINSNLQTLSKRREKFYSDSFYNVMNQIRPMGNDVSVNYSEHPENSNAAKMKINNIKRYFPEKWWNVSNTLPVHALIHRVNKSNGGRAWHNGGEGPEGVKKTITATGTKYTRQLNNSSINLFSKTNQDVVMHEFMHRMEWVNSNIHKIEEDFYIKRTGDNNSVGLGAGMRADEKYKKRIDGKEWYKNYMGKDYERLQNDGKKYRRTFELMTMGVQSVVFGDEDINKGPLKEFDEEYYNFVLGVLASV